MLFITSGFSLLLLIITSVTNNVVINFIEKTSGVPLLLFGQIEVFNISDHKRIDDTYYEDLWNCNMVWCQMWNKYINNSNIVIKLSPANVMPPCTYYENRFIQFEWVKKYQILDWIAIALALFDLLGMILVDICNHFKFKLNAYYIYLTSILLQLAAFVLIAIDISNIVPYVLGKGPLPTDDIPIKNSILNLYICLICLMILFNIIMNVVYKSYCTYKEHKVKDKEMQELLV